MKKAAVTGGGGFIGSNLVRQLLARGVETLVIGRGPYPELRQAGALVARGDIRDLGFLSQAFSGCDTVFHVAAKAGIWGSREEYFAINLTGTENVLAACRQNQVANLIHTSTPSVVFAGQDLAGDDESLPYAEKFLCHYAASKVAAERAVLAANAPELATVALRPHLVWGPGDTNLIPRLVARGRQGLLKRVGAGRNLVDISYIDNVVDAHLLAAENLAGLGTAAGKPYFISQGEPVNLWGWINEFFSLVGVPPVRKALSFRQARLAGVIMEAVYGLLRLPNEPLMTRFLAEQLAHSHWFSIAAARRDLAYQPRVSIAEGLQRTAAWLTDRGRLGH
ncbi:MAG: NAD-dependent epimerase/dehydratase family protein [Desulfobulbaceae bacterium]|nr:NAD-dependent epimerase/dehydratase family protein [Desulfobulbaceae bacterium]